MTCKELHCNRRVWNTLSCGLCRTHYMEKYSPDEIKRYRNNEHKYYDKHKDTQKERVRNWKIANPDRVRDSNRSKENRRRAEKAGSQVNEKVKLSVLRHMFKDICYLCNTVVVDGDTKLRPTHDHIVPLSRGGNNSYENAGLAHFSCNSAKGNKLLGEI